MHAKIDSEVTSLAPSPPDHKRRPAYFVQSPSRDSHDGEKTTMTLFHSTPVLGDPMGSPPHSKSFVGRHSRESSISRFAATLKPGSRKTRPNMLGSVVGKGGMGIDVIEEEGLLDDEEGRRKGLFGPQWI